MDPVVSPENESPYNPTPELVQMSDWCDHHLLGNASTSTTTAATPAASAFSSSAKAKPSKESVQMFAGQWDSDGVYVYQAYNDDIADWAVAHQTFSKCPSFNPSRMTWIKPSFGWVCYRSGYGTKHGQNRVLKIKLGHESLAEILSNCTCVDTNKVTKSTGKAARDATDASNGRVQWDPERDMLSCDADGKVPRAMLRRRAIQIGLQGALSEYYVSVITSIEDVTELAQLLGVAHGCIKPSKITAARKSPTPPPSEEASSQTKKTTPGPNFTGNKKKQETQRQQYMQEVLVPLLPKEVPYYPALCSMSTLTSLGMFPGEVADNLAMLGRGMVDR